MTIWPLVIFLTVTLVYIGISFYFIGRLDKISFKDDHAGTAKIIYIIGSTIIIVGTLVMIMTSN